MSIGTPPDEWVISIHEANVTLRWYLGCRWIFDICEWYENDGYSLSIYHATTGERLTINEAVVKLPALLRNELGGAAAWYEAMLRQKLADESRQNAEVIPFRTTNACTSRQR